MKKSKNIKNINDIIQDELYEIDKYYYFFY